MFFHNWLSLPFFYKKTISYEPYLNMGFYCFLFIGLLLGLFYVPEDYKQGDAFRIIYVHVPSAFFSLFIYLFMALMSVISLIWNIKLSKIAINASAKIGAMFTFMALVTGSIWGKPMWGTWWIWDARLTSELLMFFLYLGVIILGDTIREVNQADKSQALLALIGVINVPIIHYSVNWWFTLHQGQTFSLVNPKISFLMAFPLYVMLLAFLHCFLLLLFKLMRIEILQRSQHTQWIKVLVKEA